MQWLIECGPAESSEEADPVTSDYCIIIKPVIIRLRDKLKYRMKALLSTRTSAPNPQKTVDYFSSGRLPHLQVCIDESCVRYCTDLISVLEA